MVMVERKITAEESSLIERAHQILPGGSVGNLYNDVIIRKGQGSKVWDVSGNEYIDYVLGSGPMLVGHAHTEVVEAVRQQLASGTTFFATHEHAIALAQEIVDAVPCAEQVRFTSSGTEATHYAMRAARAFRRRDRILKFEGGFHGMNEYGLMSMSPKSPPEFPTPCADSAGIPAAIRDEVLIAPFNNIETTTAIIERHHDDLACVIVEPFQRVICPKPGFLEALREVTQRYEVPLIFDEIVTGFRFAYGGAQEFYGVTPDLCTLGKVVAGGFPLAAVAGRAELMAGFDPDNSESGNFMPQIGTLSGNPISTIAGLATLKILRRPGAFEQLFSLGRQLMNALGELLQEAQISAQVVGEPPVFDVIFTDREITDYRSSLSGDKQTLKRFNQLLLERGIFRGDTKFYISIVHTPEDLQRTIDALASAIDELKR